MIRHKNKRCFTIMILPHTEEATFSLRIPLFMIQTAVALFVFGFFGFGVLGYYYLKTAAEAQETAELRQINRAQQEEIDALAVESQRVLAQMNELDKMIYSVKEKIDEEASEVMDNPIEVSFTDPDQAAAESSGLYNHSNSINSASSSSAYLLAQSGFKEHELSYGSRSSTGRVLDRAANNIAMLHDIVPERSEALDDFGAYIEQIEEKVEQIKEKAAQTDFKPQIWPARGRITSGFGTREIPYTGGYQFHSGVDIAGSHGSSVWASASGKVTYSGYRGSLGNLLIIDHGNGYETYYAHLDGFAAKTGEEVEKGQTIGYMGRTGRTTGTHLHYEVHHSGSPVNPRRYMDRH